MTEDEARALAAQLGHPKGEDGIEVGQRMHSTNINMIRKSAAALELRPGESLIEIGHGSGAHVPELLQKYKTLSYSGLEISSTMHEQAKDGNRGFSSQAKFKLYDGQSLPMDDDSADAIAIALMNQKKFSKLDFKKFHPSGSLGEKLKTVEDLMLTKDKIPFIDENKLMTEALKIMTEKKLGTLIVRNKKKYTTGIITDGQIRRFNSKNINLNSLKVKDVMTKNPIKIDKNILATKALAIMNEKKITSLCIYEKKNRFITIGILHIHNILNKKIY